MAFIEIENNISIFRVYVERIDLLYYLYLYYIFLASI